MEISSGEFGLSNKDLITREEAVRALDDNGEHKFLFDRNKGPVFIVGTSLEDLQRDRMEPRLHEQILGSLVKQGLIISAQEARGGYCRVDQGRLFFLGLVLIRL